MKILHQSNFYQIRYEEQHQLIHYYHPAATFDMTPAQYLEELKVIIKYTREYQPKVGLGDLRDFQFIITPDLQEWIDEHLYPITQEIKLQKHAVLLPPEFVVQLSVKQALEINPNKVFETRFFTNEQEARQWLLD
ncbi:hypothetical protein BKI52_22900 [marine bacterium AO1-C]|nr:hypothetical protein BKI52_22900 [marine bacterium AO1-C]